MKLRERIPSPIKSALASLYYKVRKPSKYKSELGFWKSRHEIDHGIFRNDHYKKIMLAMAQETDEGFLRGKIVADFGCGPRGSLRWIQGAMLKIGVDVLADAYADHFKENVISHEMIYVKSTEKVIPIPSNFVDVLFTLNAMDHTKDFGCMCQEVIRILKPGGSLIGSFNLEEPATPCEPLTLTEKIVQSNLLDFLEVKSYRLSAQGPESNQYGAFFEGKLGYTKGQRAYLWVTAKKKT